jgi:hypothetical protein
MKVKLESGESVGVSASSPEYGDYLFSERSDDG